MITVLVLKDKRKLCQSLAELLRSEGYTIIEDKDNVGFMKIVRDENNRAAPTQDSIVELNDTVLREKEGRVYKYILNEIERPVIEEALERAFGNQLKAARILGINRNTLHARIKKLGIEVEQWKNQ